jgi:hypothetical protein
VVADVVAGGRLRRGGGQPAAGPDLCCFFSFFVLFAVRLNSGARQTMLHAVWTPSKLGRRLLAFLCRALHITHGK